MEVFGRKSFKKGLTFRPVNRATLNPKNGVLNFTSLATHELELAKYKSIFLVRYKEEDILYFFLSQKTEGLNIVMKRTKTAGQSAVVSMKPAVPMFMEQYKVAPNGKSKSMRFKPVKTDRKSDEGTPLIALQFEK